tara:strand:+ start:954 stop:1337 length:384 start_codon:yes stop_codon:yes gene_type:complete
MHSGKYNKGFPIFVLMESTRQKKVSRLIQKELSQIFNRYKYDILPGVMISITIARISPDLADANIFLSIFPVNEPEKALEVIKTKRGLIRKKFAEAVKNDLRIIPNFNFYLDDSAAYFEEIDRLLKK